MRAPSSGCASSGSAASSSTPIEPTLAPGGGREQPIEGLGLAKTRRGPLVIYRLD